MISVLMPHEAATVVTYPPLATQHLGPPRVVRPQDAIRSGAILLCGPIRLSRWHWGPGRGQPAPRQVSCSGDSSDRRKRASTIAAPSASTPGVRVVRPELRENSVIPTPATGYSFFNPVMCCQLSIVPNRREKVTFGSLGANFWIRATPRWNRHS